MIGDAGRLVRCRHLGQIDPDPDRDPWFAIEAPLIDPIFGSISTPIVISKSKFSHFIICHNPVTAKVGPILVAPDLQPQ